MNRQDFQNLALIRLQEAEILLQNGHYSGAYYLSGYVVECALKACIAKHTKEFDFPDKQVAIDSHTHDLVKLVKNAKLDKELASRRSDPNFGSNWLLVIEHWKPESRYKTYTEQEAHDMYSAIADPDYGVFQWLQQHY